MIPRELIRKIRKIEITTHRLVNDQLAGQYHSVFKGRGMAFSEVRQYQPGDDIRLIDWNVSARMRGVFVKLFTEEREMTVMLLVDMSASSFFGSFSQTKREVAAEVAAMMAFSAIKNNDRVGLLIFTEEVEKFVPPKKGRKHVLRVISEILSYQPRRRGTDVAAALQFLGRVAKRHSVAFLLTDFLVESVARPEQAAAGERIEARRPGPDERLERALRIIARRHDLIPVTITDPLEQRLPALGLVNLVDLESGDLVTFDSGGPEARGYAEDRRRAREARQVLFRKLKVDAMELSTGEPYVDELVRFFRLRQMRLRH